MVCMYVSVAWDLHHTFSLHNLTLMHFYRSRATMSFLQQSILYFYRLSRRVLLGPTVSRKKNCFGSVWLKLKFSITLDKRNCDSETGEV